jgi:hypothetical protein
VRRVGFERAAELEQARPEERQLLEPHLVAGEVRAGEGSQAFRFGLHELRQQPRALADATVSLGHDSR